jgi:hypothetical protein
MHRIFSGSKVVLLSLLFFFILLQSLEAGSKRGAEIVVQKKDGNQIHGELIAVKKTSLLLLESASGIDVSVQANEIGIVHILKGPKTGLGAISGFLVGGVVGVAATGKGNDCGQCPNSASRNIIGGALVGGIGALIGALIGSTSGSNEIIILQGLSQEELIAELEKMRSKARVKNFQ